MADVRLIDANVLNTSVALYMAENAYLNDTPLDILKMVSRWIAEAPTISAVPVVHGRWDKPVEHGLPYAANHLGVVCSYCCKWSDNDYNYCPNCGAKMDGEKGKG